MECDDSTKVQSVYVKICEVGKKLDQIRKNINSEKLEIVRCEELLQNHKTSLNKYLEIKEALKHERGQLLNSLKSNWESDEDYLEPICKVESQFFNVFENSTTESLTSFSCVNSVCTEPAFNPELSISTNQKSLKQSQPDPIDSGNSLPSSNNRIQNNNSSNTNGTTKKSSLNGNESIQSEAPKTDGQRKRKSSDTSQSVSSRRRKTGQNQINGIYQFMNRKLTCIVSCHLGLIFAGSNGMLQLRDSETFEVKKKFLGFEKKTIEKVIVAHSEEGTFILACSIKNFIIFNALTGKILKTDSFNSKINAFTCTKTKYFIGIQCGTFYTFDLITFTLTNLVSISDTFVQSIVEVNLKGKPMNLMGCQNGIIYLQENDFGKPYPTILTNRSNVYCLTELSNNYLFSYSDKSIDIYSILTLDNLFRLQNKLSENFEKIIRKVVQNGSHLFVLFDDGSITVYEISKGLPNFKMGLSYTTSEATIKDISVNENKAYLIGDTKVYLLTL